MFADFKSKYFDIYQKVKRDTSKEKYTILDEIDFQAELIHRDQINVAYILQLLKELVQIQDEDKRDDKMRQIDNILSSSVPLKSKRKLIEMFIEKHSLNLMEDEIEDLSLDEDEKTEEEPWCLTCREMRWCRWMAWHAALR